MLADTTPQAQATNAVDDDTIIVGKAKYKGREYLLLWEGNTSRGQAAKLAFRDGSKVFWASFDEYEIVKRYHDREWRGRTEPGMTFGRLDELAADYKKATANGIKPCGKCGGLHTDGGCYMCGCTKCEGAHGGLCEED